MQAVEALLDGLAINGAKPLYLPRGHKMAEYPGMIERGNIDLASRPVVRNEDGSISTVRSIGVNIDGAEILIPTVSPDGRILADEEAIQLYRDTGKHLGKFQRWQDSDAYAKRLHDDQALIYGGQ